MADRTAKQARVEAAALMWAEYQARVRHPAVEAAWTDAREIADGLLRQDPDFLFDGGHGYAEFSPQDPFLRPRRTCRDHGLVLKVFPPFGEGSDPPGNRNH